ncbi:hypothetical protein KHM83_06315 [Fusibacter paucivorans]|uniref:tRNA(Ile2) 2-agmatinylcytidine synthetase n=1 Tax=Fusibacter paucivorans TaxID=76009 RepID=A0ABS5PM76_9FIRM|nr:hypothetical protein [Fusibacter paucivorans]MBS7526284.1 hypothetical protein [Fusibacter paucivorans]
MKFFLCLDDTDNVDSIGTGELVERIKREIAAQGIGKCHHITRHQLLIHEAIPYTSHNSSMCLEGEAPRCSMRLIQDIGIDIIRKFRAAGSDPGFCMIGNPTINEKNMLIHYGQRATTEVLTKQEAYDLAYYLGIHLSEHGGTGDGIIGAMAGIGLRLSGNHGEAKGLLKRVENQRFTVKALQADYDIEVTETTMGKVVPENAEILIYQPTKVILKDHRFTLLVDETPQGYVALDKRVIRQTQMGAGFVERFDYQVLKTYQLQAPKKACRAFVKDMEEECIDAVVGVCWNCKYRRWSQEGMTCLKGIV